MCYNGGKYLACGLCFFFLSSASYDCCNLATATQPTVWFLSNISPFLQDVRQKPSRTSFSSMAAAMRRLRSAGAALAVIGRTSTWVARKWPGSLSGCLGAGSPCLDALFWRTEKTTAATWAKWFSVVCKSVSIEKSGRWQRSAYLYLLRYRDNITLWVRCSTAFSGLWTKCLSGSILVMI